MKLGRCPHCHGHIDLHACVQDEAGRELLALMARTPSPLARSLVQYLTLFRPGKQDLSNSRALSLAQSALELAKDADTLAAAMNETVTSIRGHSGTRKPMKNHNYLKQVLVALMEKGAGAPFASVAPEDHPPEAHIERDTDAAYRQQMARLGYSVDGSGRVCRLEPDDE